MLIEAYKPTHDDWYGNYKVQSQDLELVNVGFTQTGPTGAKSDWRVAVWGTDDCGMEKDFADEAAALNMFYQIIGWDYVDRDHLLQNGFVSA